MRNTLDAVVTQWNLLNHPFYQAWSAGTLPTSALQSYATEYGAFIRELPQGWRALGDEEAARVEEDHARLWDEFATALSTRVGNATVPQVQALVATAKDLFSEPATALGALYAFEVQQPKTAESKLEGLATHYKDLPAGIRPYFEAHAQETGEDTLLLEFMRGLSKEGRERCKGACEKMSKAMWDALSGLHTGSC